MFGDRSGDIDGLITDRAAAFRRRLERQPAPVIPGVPERDIAAFRGQPVAGRFHDFSADTGGGDYGSELDLSAGRKLGDRYNLLLKLAMFDADDASYVDTTKIWVMLTAGF